MSLTLIETRDTYYTYSQLVKIHDDIINDVASGLLSDLYLGDLKDEALDFLIQKLSQDVFNALQSPLVAATKTAWEIGCDIETYLTYVKIKNAMLLLEAANLNGAVRFRTKIYKDSTKPASKPYVVGDCAVTYNSNY